MSGTFFAVVGPSGAGKDSLIAFAKDRLADDLRFAFPARCITRPVGAGGEDHIEIAPDAFADLRAAGGFVLDWEAHGLCYGIPSDVAGLVETETGTWRNVDPPILVGIAERLAARGRESKVDIEARLRRASSAGPSGDDVFRLNNAGRLEDAGTALVDLLISHGSPVVRA